MTVLQNDAFDVVIIGGGPGGYVCAIRASQLGFRVACVDKRPSLGGTCLNIGCIPSKALLHSSHKFSETKDHLLAHGIETTGIKLNLKAMLERKSKVVEDLTKGISFLFKKNNITHIEGEGICAGAGGVLVKLNTGAKRSLKAKHIVLATGSVPASLPGIEIDEERIVSSTGALSLKKVPQHLVIIGGGYIGLEMGSIWGRLGAKITVVEFLDTIVPMMDKEVSQALFKQLCKQNFEFKLATKVIEVKKTASHIKVSLEALATGAKSEFTCDVVLVAAGRKPYTQGLGLDKIGVQLDERGYVKVDSSFQTTIPGVYAIGDVVGGAMLAHKAEEEGVALAEILAGQAGHVNYQAIPSVVYTYPEAASVGATEEELKQKAIPYRVGTFPMMANSRARANGETEGFVKILSDFKTDKVLGVHILALEAGTMIAEAVMAMEFGSAAEDIARTCHAHPTLSEALKEAALAVDGRAIHI